MRHHPEEQGKLAAIIESARCLAVDFGGTLAHPGPSPDGAIVACVLSRRLGLDVPTEFEAAFDDAQREVLRRDREGTTHTPFAEIVRLAAHRLGMPSVPTAVEAYVFDLLPDATVDPRAASALRRLHQCGLGCVLACDSQRPLAVRRRTLKTAAIEGCFKSLVLSSELGVRKPHPLFYMEVLDAAGCSPDSVVFIGDTPAKDVIGPRRHGMRAVLIAPAGERPNDLPDDVPVVQHLESLADVAGLEGA
jgi:FMN phosphatase YigB (HAD superfamily)